MGGSRPDLAVGRTTPAQASASRALCPHASGCRRCPSSCSWPPWLRSFPRGGPAAQTAGSYPRRIGAWSPHDLSVRLEPHARIARQSQIELAQRGHHLRLEGGGKGVPLGRKVEGSVAGGAPRVEILGQVLLGVAEAVGPRRPRSPCSRGRLPRDIHLPVTGLGRQGPGAWQSSHTSRAISVRDVSGQVTADG